ncbi:MAG: hypothetical protein BWY31_03609 [Lentisphaerae bacterium ADurb.Bin242]|nr:MAG: hypothetical protein BWY31_03609 [Lentisphaerae bacterium ADurb.Bin242]
MIELSSGVVNILYADGTSAAFDAAELRLRLEKSCVASGMADPWIAGEIALSVEYALRSRRTDPEAGNVVHAADIDDCVVRILEETGYAAVARYFRNNAAASGDFGKLTPDRVEEFLCAKLQISPAGAAPLIRKVCDAMNALGAEKCSPRLVIELARHFREVSAHPRLQPLHPEKLPAVRPEPVPEQASPVAVRRTDSLFPSIRAEIDLTRLFADCRLAPPLTELSLMPFLAPCAEKLDAACAELRRNGAETLPLLLTFSGFQEFARKWLNCDYSGKPDSRVEFFSDFFRSLLREKPFKVFVR